MIDISIQIILIPDFNLFMINSFRNLIQYSCCRKKEFFICSEQNRSLMCFFVMVKPATQVELTPSDPIGSDSIRQFPTVGSDRIPTVGNRHFPLISDSFRRRILSDSGYRIRWYLTIGNCRIRWNPVRSDDFQSSDPMKLMI